MTDKEIKKLRKENPRFDNGFRRELTKEQAELQIELDEALSDLNTLKDKKYNFWDIIKGTKRHDIIQEKETKDYIFYLKMKLDAKEKELDNFKNIKEEVYEKTV